MYTKEKIGIELKEKINQKFGASEIGKWALGVYLTDVAATDPELDKTLSRLMMMDEGAEFALPYKELEQIANLLIVADSSIYTQQQFGKELKEKVIHKEEVSEIANWAYALYLEYVGEVEDDFQGLLLDLGGMSAGPEFEFSYEELDQIADRLIAGERNIELYGVVENPIYKK